MTDDQAKRIEEKLDLLLSVIVVQQKDVAEIAGVTDDTIRNHVKRGKLNVLQREGSRLNYLILKDAGDLKRRRKE